MSQGRIAKARTQHHCPLLVAWSKYSKTHWIWFNRFLSSIGSDTLHTPRIKTTATFKAGMGKCNLKKSQEKLLEGFNNALSGTRGPKQPNLIHGN